MTTESAPSASDLMESFHAAVESQDVETMEGLADQLIPEGPGSDITTENSDEMLLDVYREGIEQDEDHFDAKDRALLDKLAGDEKEPEADAEEPADETPNAEVEAAPPEEPAPDFQQKYLDLQQKQFEFQQEQVRLQGEREAQAAQAKADRERVDLRTDHKARDKLFTQMGLDPTNPVNQQMLDSHLDVQEMRSQFTQLQAQLNQQNEFNRQLVAQAQAMNTKQAITPAMGKALADYGELPAETLEGYEADAAYYVSQGLSQQEAVATVIERAQPLLNALKEARASAPKTKPKAPPRPKRKLSLAQRQQLQSVSTPKGAPRSKPTNVREMSTAEIADRWDNLKNLFPN